MDVVIYQSLIIYTVALFYGVHTLSVVIKGSKEGLLGENGTEIECVYPREQIQTIYYVSFMTFNRSSMSIDEIATYTPNQPPLLLPKGKYLEGRVTLTPITQSSTKAVMTFNKLMCIDDTFYQCKVSYRDNSGNSDQNSNNRNISVQVAPSKPDSVLFIYTPANSLMTTTTDMDYSTSLPSTGVTSIKNNSISASEMESQNTTTGFNHSTIQTTSHTTTSTPHHEDDVSSNVSYKTTSYSTQQQTIDKVLAEGDNLTVVCKGEVGKPPAEHFFQKYRGGNSIPQNYTVTKTSISEMSDNCSYYRTSDLTFQVTAEDNQAVIRCVINSSMAESDKLYVESAPIEVYYEVTMPNIVKSPNKTYYVIGEDTSITLTCKSDGHPKPIYQWYQENHNKSIGIKENLTIMDMNVTNSGVYTCKVSNFFNGYTFQNTTSVLINIMNKADILTTSSIGSSSGVDKKEKKSEGNLGLVIGIVVAVVIVIIVISVIIACMRWKSKSPTSKNVSKSFDDSKPKPGTEPRTGDYDYIALEDDAPKTKSSNNGLEVEDIKKHNKEYLQKQEEEEKKKNESNTPPQPAVYAQVNEASKLKNKQKTETPEKPDKQEEDPYAETQEDVYDEAGKPRHKENKNAEQFDVSINLSKHKSNDDNKLSIHTSQVGSYVNQVFEKDENRKIATVSPTVRSSSGSQNDEQTNSNRNSQSKKEYENIIGTDQTGILEEESSHRTAL